MCDSYVVDRSDPCLQSWLVDTALDSPGDRIYHTRPRNNAELSLRPSCI